MGVGREQGKEGREKREREISKTQKSIQINNVCSTSMQGSVGHQHPRHPSFASREA